MSAGTGITNTVAVGAVSSPWWMIYIIHLSDAAAIALPILGAAWLLIQIANFFWPRNDVQLEVKQGKTTVTTKGTVSLVPPPNVELKAPEEPK